MNDSYQPGLCIGVTHLIKNLPALLEFLDGKVVEGTVVGTEAYSYPLDHLDHWKRMDNREFVSFFDGLGNFVVSKGGSYVPLQRYEHFWNSYRLDFDDEFRGRYNLQVEKLVAAYTDLGLPAEEADFYSGLEIDPIDEVGLAEAKMRLLKRMLLEDGFDSDETRDTTLVDLVTQKKPDYVVVGQFHIPALMARFPETKVKFIGHK